MPRRTPVPGMPGAVPIMTYPVPQGGTMVSHPNVAEPYSPAEANAVHPVDLAALASDYDGVVTTPTTQFDVTERVQARRHATPTNFIRAAPRRKGPIVAVAVCAAAAGTIAAFIAFGGSTPAVPVTQPEPVTQPALDHTAAFVGSDRAAEPPTAPIPVTTVPASAPPPTPVTPAVEPPVAPPPAPEPTIANHATPNVDDTKAKPVAHPVVVKKSPPVPARPRPHPVAKPKPEDKPAWNADSPFMPVRTDKH